LDLRRVFGQSSCGHLGVEIAGALGEPAERHRRSQGSEWAGWCAGRGLGSSSPDGQGFTCRGLGSCSWVSILSSPAANCYMSSPTVTNRDSVKSRRRLRTEDIARCRASCSCNGWPGTAATVRRLPQLAATSETRWIGGHCNKAVAHCDDIGRPRDALPPIRLPHGAFTCLALSRDGQAPIVWSRCSVSRALGVPIHPKVGVVVGVGSSR
jgi:hypothetical protein